jgi:DNA replication protein DnaC
MEHMNDGMNNSPLMRRFLANPTTQADANWTCTTCGIIRGRQVTLMGATRYLREKCACQKAEALQKEHDKRRMDWVHWQKGRTFSWLGDRWDDSALLEKTFANFDYGPQREAYETTRMFTQLMRGTLVLHGTFGTGKTHLLAALCNDLREVEKGSLFVTAPKLFSSIQTKIALHEDYSGIITSAMKTNLLVIDDIDKAKHSDFREEIYFEIIDERVKAGRPIAISTNRLDELEHYVGGAVCSRLKVGQIDVAMLGLDYREVLDIA